MPHNVYFTTLLRITVLLLSGLVSSFHKQLHLDPGGRRSPNNTSNRYLGIILC